LTEPEQPTGQTITSRKDLTINNLPDSGPTKKTPSKNHPVLTMSKIAQFGSTIKANPNLMTNIGFLEGSNGNIGSSDDFLLQISPVKKKGLDVDLNLSNLVNQNNFDDYRQESTPQYIQTNQDKSIERDLSAGSKILNFDRNLYSSGKKGSERELGTVEEEKLEGGIKVCFYGS
jgi:hypothetical protein